MFIVVTFLMGPVWAGQEDHGVPATQLHPPDMLTCRLAEQRCQNLGHLSSHHSAGEPGYCRWGHGTRTQMLWAAAWAVFKGLQQ